MESTHIAVIGGGLCGLSTAWQLARRNKKVHLLEARTFDHLAGSSHGAARIFRTAYTDPLYADLMVEAEAEWAHLEQTCGQPLRHARPACFFGPKGGPWDRFAETARVQTSSLHILDLPTARARFPMFRFLDGDGVISDDSAGVVAAADTLAALVDAARALGATLETHRPVTALGFHPSGWRLETPRGVLYADKLVVCAGPWTAALLPTLAAPLTVVPQTVAYLDYGVPPEDFPVWAWFGTGDEPEVQGDFFYGLEDVGEHRHKAASHLTSGPGIDPDAPRPDPDGTDLRRFLDWRIVGHRPRILAEEGCVYTCTDDEDFVLSAVPGMPDLVVGAGLSGHGFKFGPLLGRILAELCIDYKTTVAPFEAHRGRFSL